MFVCLQETWLPNEESKEISKDFSDYEFLTTSSDMFTDPEDVISQSGPVWHGTAIGWNKSISKYITRLPVISDRFCGVKYKHPSLSVPIITYSAYLPTAGQDDHFAEVLDMLKHDITQNMIENAIVIIGSDSNVSNKSTNRRRRSMEHFLNEFPLNPVLKN